MAMKMEEKAEEVPRQHELGAVQPLGGKRDKRDFRDFRDFRGSFKPGWQQGRPPTKSLDFYARPVRFDARGLFSLLLVSKLVLSELFRVHEYSRAAWSGLEWL